MANSSHHRIESDARLRDHPKVQRLADELGVSKKEAVGCLLFLWGWAKNYAPDGNLEKFYAPEIAKAAEWSGDPNVFLDRLCMVGWLDEDPLRIHDWDDFQQQQPKEDQAELFGSAELQECDTKRKRYTPAQSRNAAKQRMRDYRDRKRVIGKIEAQKAKNQFNLDLSSKPAMSADEEDQNVVVGRNMESDKPSFRRGLSRDEAPTWEQFWEYCKMIAYGCEWHARDCYRRAAMSRWHGKEDWQYYAEHCREWWRRDGAPMNPPRKNYPSGAPVRRPTGEANERKENIKPKPL